MASDASALITLEFCDVYYWLCVVNEEVWVFCVWLFKREIDQEETHGFISLFVTSRVNNELNNLK